MRIKWRIIPVVILILCLLSGCGLQGFLPQRQELVLLSIAQLVTIDITDEGNFRLGAMFVLESGKDDVSGSEHAGVTYVYREAPTVAQAEQLLQNAMEKKIFWGHTDYLLIGERAAREELVAALDFLTRNLHFRLSAALYLTLGDASDLSQRGQELPYSLHQYLDIYNTNDQQVLKRNRLELLRFIGPFLEKYTALPVPIVEIRDQEVFVEGYGIIKNHALGEILWGNGYSYASNQVNTDIIPITDQQGKRMALRVIDSNTDIRIQTDNGRLTGITLDCVVESGIEEVENITLDTGLNAMTQLEMQQSDYIRTEIERMIEASQTWNTDVLCLWKLVWTRQPVIWSGIEAQWDQLYPDLPITVSVSSKIRRTYDIKDFSREGMSEWK